MKNILEKRRIKIEKHEVENFKTFKQSSYKLQVLITKISILSDRENVVFILTYKIFPKMYKREFGRDITGFYCF